MVLVNYYKQWQFQVMKLLDDPTKPLLGLPRYAVISGAATLVLLAAASMI